jgi:hypothetical protein
VSVDEHFVDVGSWVEAVIKDAVDEKVRLSSGIMSVVTVGVGGRAGDRRRSAGCDWGKGRFEGRFGYADPV